MAPWRKRGHRHALHVLEWMNQEEGYLLDPAADKCGTLQLQVW